MGDYYVYRVTEVVEEVSILSIFSIVSRLSAPYLLQINKKAPDTLSNKKGSLNKQLNLFKEN